MVCNHNDRDLWIGKADGIFCKVCGAKINTKAAPSPVKKTERAPEPEAKAPTKKAPVKKTERAPEPEAKAPTKKAPAKKTTTKGGKK